MIIVKSILHYKLAMFLCVTIISRWWQKSALSIDNYQVSETLNEDLYFHGHA